MNIEEFRGYCLAMDGVTEKMPFGKLSRHFASILALHEIDLTDQIAEE